jgi:hypothetical protein
MSRKHKTFPRAVALAQTTHFTINHVVICGGTSIGYFDEPTRAEMVAKALNSWRRTKAGQRWWRRQYDLHRFRRGIRQRDR